MDTIYMPAGEKTPEVKLSVSNCIFEIKGSSYSDTVFEDVYHTVLEWIDEEIPKLEGELNCIFTIDILNSTTYKNIMQMLIKFTEYEKQGKKIRVTWYFDGHDEDNEELAEDLSQVFDIPFTIKEL